MSFNSLAFLIFLPVVVLLYYLLPHKCRWLMLLIASYLSYMCWNAWLIVLIMTTTVTAYLCSIGIERGKTQKRKKFCLVVAIVVCLGMLLFFKYINFILESVVGVVRLFGGQISDISLQVILPVGISFYTFQTLSYVIDVYRGEVKAERHFGYFALYVVYFPQLVAGPIERPQTLLPQLHEEHKADMENFKAGAKWLISGFIRKCVIADFCGVIVDGVYANLGSSSGLSILIASLLFLVQIYNDFAGYSEIALGSARLMGVKLSKNFDKPLLSVSYTEFFRRWHITLNQWFTQYVYIPLGGNRKGKVRKVLNTLIVFSLCGLWHGANWTFVLWGLVAGIMVSIESLLTKPIRKFCERKNINLDNAIIVSIRRVILFVLFSLSCILFRAQSLSEAFIAFSRLFTAWNGKLSAVPNELGLTVVKMLELVIFIVVTCVLHRLTDEPKENEKQEKLLINSCQQYSVLPTNYSVSGVNDVCKLPLSKGRHAQKNAKNTLEITTVVFGIFAIALCWIGLLAMGDSSSFAYFQF